MFPYRLSQAYIIAAKQTNNRNVPSLALAICSRLCVNPTNSRRAGGRIHNNTIGMVIHSHHGPLARYVILQVAYTSGMPGTFSPPPRVSDPDMHHVTHVPWCMRELLTSGFLWSRRWGKRSRDSWCMCNPQFYVSSKRPMHINILSIFDRQWLTNNPALRLGHGQVITTTQNYEMYVLI